MPLRTLTDRRQPQAMSLRLLSALVPLPRLNQCSSLHQRKTTLVVMRCIGVLRCRGEGSTPTAPAHMQSPSASLSGLHLTLQFLPPRW